MSICAPCASRLCRARPAVAPLAVVGMKSATLLRSVHSVALHSQLVGLLQQRWRWAGLAPAWRLATLADG